MGGPVPLGYVVEDRRLVVHDEEAELVRHIYERYLALGSVAEQVDALGREGRRTKLQLRTSGPHRGGTPFRRGTLFHLPAYRIYLGEIVHKGAAYLGEHPAIVPRNLWEAVQAKLVERGPGRIRRTRTQPSPLIGLMYDGPGRAMTANHAVKGTKRYRYYATRAPAGDQPAWRVGAHDIERVVADRLEALYRDRNRIARLIVAIDPRSVDRAVAAAASITRDAIAGDRQRYGLERIDLAEEKLVITVSRDQLLRGCGIEPDGSDGGAIMLEAIVCRVRRGHKLRLIVSGGGAALPAPTERHPGLIRLLADAMEARDLVLASPDRTIAQIADDRQRCRKRLTKLFRLSLVAPSIVERIMRGEQPAHLMPAALLDYEPNLSWADQNRALAID